MFRSFLKINFSLESSGNEKYELTNQLISKSLTKAGIPHKIDITGTSIVKRYARTNELGVPFSITVNLETSITIRERERIKRENMSFSGRGRFCYEGVNSGP